MTIGDAETVLRSVDELAIQAFHESVRGEVLRPGDRGYDAARSVWNAMIDRRPALIARCAGAADVIAAVRFASEHGLLVSVKAGGSRRRRYGRRGRRPDDRPLADERDPRSTRYGGRLASGGGATWGELDRETQALRPGDHRRNRPDDGHCRPHARRRAWLPDAPLRPGLRQPALGRRRHRRRRAADGERRRAPRPVLGPARWQRQLRRRHLLRVPAPPRRPDGARRFRFPSLRPGPRGGPLLPRVHQHRAGRADDLPRLRHLPRRPPGRGLHRLLQRPGGGGRAGASAAAGLRHSRSPTPSAPCPIRRCRPSARRSTRTGRLNYWKSNFLDGSATRRSRP